MAHGDIIINITEEQAVKILEHLPGTPEMYHELADAFLDAMGERGYDVPSRRHRHKRICKNCDTSWIMHDVMGCIKYEEAT